MIRRTLALAAVVVVAMAGVQVLAFAPAAHAQYYQCLDPRADPDNCIPDVGGITLDNTNVVSGSTISVGATGCTIGSTVTFFLDGSAVGSAITDVDGVATARVTIVAAPGEHRISNSCNNAIFAISVVAAGVGAGSVDGAATGPPLARTGTGSTLPLARLATVAITTGGLLLIAARKHRARSDAAPA